MTYDKDSFLAGLSVGMSLRYSKRIPAPVNCLTFSSPTIFTISIRNSSKNWDGTLEYSTDARNWSVWDGTTTITANIAVGTYKIFLRGSGNTKITGGGFFLSYRGFVISGNNISCTGDIRTLLDYSDVENTIMAPYCFYALFYGCATLVTAPSLPATTLSHSCYKEMFSFCTSLANPPPLPATTLAQECYASMFTNCIALISVPALPSSILATQCYLLMFSNCSGLKVSQEQTAEYYFSYRIPASGNGTPATNAMLDMFRGTGGTFAGTPTINTTYYTSNTVIS